MINGDNEVDHSLALLVMSVGKDYFQFKMNVEPKVNNCVDVGYVIEQGQCEFMCDLIQKQHLCICELESKMKIMFNEVKILKEEINKKEELLKTLNDNVINTFIQSNYEQEQIITMLQQELDTMKTINKIKSGCNNNNVNNVTTTTTMSNVAQTTLTTTREDNNKSSYISKRNSKDDKSFRMMLYKDNTNKCASKTQSPLQSQNQSVIVVPEITTTITTTCGNKQNKGINVYLHKEKLKLMDSTRSGNRNYVSGCSNKRMQTSINVSRNNSNKKQSCSNLTTSTRNNNNNNNTSEIKAKINKMKLNINNKLFRPFPTVSKTKTNTKNKRQISSLY